MPAEADVLEALRAVIDPELGDNIVDLGMVTGGGGHREGAVRVDVALTIAGCPLRTQLEPRRQAAPDREPRRGDQRWRFGWERWTPRPGRR